MGRLGLVLGAPGVAALGTGVHVEAVLGVAGVAALGTGVHLEAALSVAGLAALDIGPFLDAAGEAAFAGDRLADLVLSLLLPADLR